MIYDCFMFHNEWDVLEIRLKELYDRVDRFVIVEADKTHSGKTREQDLQYCFDRYAKWAGKIINLKVQLPEVEDGQRWKVENAHRNGILRCLGDLRSDDWVFISDCDEIPNLASWNANEGSFACMNAAYKVNTIHQHPWNGPCVVRGWRFTSPFGAITPQDVRNFRDVLRNVGVGWHFGWMTDPKQKAQDFAHEELDDGRNFDTKVHPGDGSPLVTIPIGELFPACISSDQDRYSHLIAEVS